MSTLQIFPHDSVGFALQSMEDSVAGGEFHPGEPCSLPLSVPHMESWVTQPPGVPCGEGRSQQEGGREASRRTHWRVA